MAAGAPTSSRPMAALASLREPWSDRRTEFALGAVACFVLAIVVGMVVFVFSKAWPSFAENGLGWFGDTGNVNQQLDRIQQPGTAEPVYEFGAFDLIWGTVLTTGAAVGFGIVFATLAAVFIVEFAPPVIERILTPTVSLLAAVPSVIYGLIGILVLAPFIGGLVSDRKPDVERHRSTDMLDAMGGKPIEHKRSAPLVAGALFPDMLVVGPRGDGRGLGRRRDDQARFATQLHKLLHQCWVTRVQAVAHAGEIGTLRQAVQREYAIGATLENRVRIRCKLDVTLVAYHDHTVCTPPLGGGTQHLNARGSTRGIARNVDPQHSRSPRVSFGDRVEIELPMLIEGYGHSPTPCELGTEGVGGIRNGRVQDRVAPGRAVAAPEHVEVLRQRCNEFLGANARGNCFGFHRQAESAVHPLRARATVCR